MGNRDIDFGSKGWRAGPDWVVKALGSAGGAQTLDTSDVTTITLTSNATFALPAPVIGMRLRVIVTMGGAGSYTCAFTGAKWAGGTAYVPTTAASSVDAVALDCLDGSSWYGSVLGKAYA